MSKNVKGFSSQALAKLQKYNWPGNVRELKNLVERAVVFCKDDIIDLYHLPLHAHGKVSFNFARLPSYKINDMEKGLIEHVLWENQHNQSKTSKILGISRTTLHSRIRRYGLDDYTK